MNFGKKLRNQSRIIPANKHRVQFLHQDKNCAACFTDFTVKSKKCRFLAFKGSESQTFSFTTGHGSETDDTHLELPCDNSKFYYSDPSYRRDSKVPGPYNWLVWPYHPPAPWPGRCVQPRVEHHWVKPLFGFKHNLSLSTQGLPHGTGLGLLLVAELIVTFYCNISVSGCWQNC